MWTFVCLLLMEPLQILGEGDLFTVYDKKEGFSETFESYEAAYAFYTENLENYENLILTHGEEVIVMEYGIVGFRNDAACSLDHEYESISKDETDLVNGCYGSDALYLGTSRDGSKVEFLLSGDRGLIGIDKVVLHPLEDLDERITSYAVRDGKLWHDIRNQWEIDFYAYSLRLDEALPFMKEGRTYYSYDGHYFYDDLKLLADDERNGDHINALNESAYYNYYQYLPHRSYSNFTTEEFERYFYEDLGLNGRLFHYEDLSGDKANDEVNRSQLYGQVDVFTAAEKLFGTNSLLLLSAAVEESSYGKSYDSFAKNRLFSLSAYEDEEDRDEDRYDSIEEGIYSYAKYVVSSRLADHFRGDYKGTFLGDKVSGINCSISADPYYGEKIAALAYRMDETLGLKDKDAYALAIIKDKDRLTFYYDQEMNRRRFVLDDIEELSLIVLEEDEGSYKVRLDHSYNDEYFYDPELSCAYIAKENVALLINEDQIGEEKLHDRHYDLNGGDYHGLHEIDAFSRNDETLKIRPKKDACEFMGFDEEGKASYIGISSIELGGRMNETFEAGGDLDLGTSYLKVRYEDGSERQIPLNTDMILSYDRNSEEKQDLVIGYNGLEIRKPILFSEGLRQSRVRFENAIRDGDHQMIKEDLSLFHYPFTFSQIRNIDYELMNIDKRNYVIEDRTQRFDLSISGLDLSLPDRRSLSFIPDTYYVIVDEISEEDAARIHDLAKGYGFEKTDGLDISFRFNYQSSELLGPAIVQIGVQDKRNDLIYSVYHLNADGDIVKCRTTQSDSYIQFMIRESGPYLVLTLPSANVYEIKDAIEDLSYENMGVDNHRTNFELMAILVMSLMGLIGITLYYIVYNERKRLWRDFRRSLQEAAIVPEEKPRN